METARLVTEGFTGEIVAAESAWPIVYAAFQNRTILQVEAKGVKNHAVGNSEIPCLLVQVGNVTGIVPAHEAGLKNVPETAEEIQKLSSEEKRALIRKMESRLVGLPVWILILAVDRKNEIFVASRRRALEIKAPQTWSKIEEGAVLPGTVRELYPKRAVLDLGGVEAVMFAHEMSWGWVDDARDVLELGRTYEVKVIKADRENSKVEVSLKQAQPCPWPDCAKRYSPGGVYSGIVSGIIEQGVFVNLEPGVDCLAHHPKFTRVKKGDRVKVRIRRVDEKKQKMYGNIRG